MVSVLVLIGSLSNSVGIYDISKEAFKDRRYRNKQERRRICRTKLLLVSQLVILAIIIGIASWLFLKNFPGLFDYIRLILSVILIITALWIAAYLKLKNVALGIVIFILLHVVSLYVFPDIINLFFREISKTVDRCIDPNFSNFIKDRFFSYLNLIIIPLLYLIPDILNKEIIEKAKKSIPIDFGLVLVGFLCFFAGLAARDPLFEAGCSAAIILLSNYFYTFILET